MRWPIGVVVTRLFLIVIAAGLTSCAIVDQYSGHAVAYNIEAEQAQEQQLVLNIVRASLRRPMQFTSVTTITGSQSVSATAGLTAPFGYHGNLMNDTGTLGASASGGPIFTVPVLDTQDFYRGMLQGIPPQLIDLLLHAGYSPELIFNLLIEKIEMSKVDPTGKKCPANAHWTECEFYVYNDVSSDTQIELFHTLVRYLVVLGMTTEPRDDPSKPPPSSGGAATTTADSTKSKNSTGGSSGNSDPLPVSYVFCFAPKDKDVGKWLMQNSSSYCGNYKTDNSKPKPKNTATATATATATGAATATATATAPGAAPATATATAAPPAAPVTEHPAPSEKQGTPSDNGQNDNAKTNTLQKQEIKRTAELTLYLAPEIVDDMACVMGSYDNAGYSFTENKLWGSFRNQDKTPVKVQLKFFMRSTSGLLNFLGQIVARDLNPGMFRPEYATNPRRIWIGDTTTYRYRSGKTEPFDPTTQSEPNPSTPVESLDPSAGPCRHHFDSQYYTKIHHYGVLFYENLFVLQQGVPFSGSYLSVEYEGRRYSVPNDPAVAGWTTQVLDIVKQLMAVNTSAAALPQTSVISVISP